VKNMEIIRKEKEKEVFPTIWIFFQKRISRSYKTQGKGMVDSSMDSVGSRYGME
jgi:hypothetical protein